MSTSGDKQYSKILDYLEVLATSLNELKECTIERFSAIDQRFSAIDQRFSAIDQRFDALDEDMATLKGAARRIEERQKVMEQSVATLQNADRNRQDDILQLSIRVERIEERLKSSPAPRHH